MKQLFIVIGTVMLLNQLCAKADFSFGTFLYTNSPDGNVAVVNGVFIAKTGFGLGWFHDWGDGTRGTDCFPAIHRYQQPGDYTITTRGFNDSNEFVNNTLSYNVPKAAYSIGRVELSEDVVGMKSNDSVVVKVRLYDSMNNAVPYAGQQIDLFYIPFYQSEVVTTSVSGDSITLTAPALKDRDCSFASIYVYVDKVESVSPITVVVNRNPEPFTLIAGEYVVTWLPSSFFEKSALLDTEIRQVLDAGFLAMDKLCNFSWPEKGKIRQCVSYLPEVYGANGNPIVLGRYAIPQDTTVTIFPLVFHEMGHNFAVYNMLFGYCAVEGPFYHETIAVWYTQYVLDELMKSDLSVESKAALLTEFNRSRDYVASEYNGYLQRGKLFDYDKTQEGSQALVHVIYQNCYKDGFDKVAAFMDHFNYKYMPMMAVKLAKYGGLSSISNRVSIFVAALSSTFHKNMKSEFLELNFPINEGLFDELYDYWSTDVVRPLLKCEKNGEQIRMSWPIESSVSHGLWRSKNLSEWSTCSGNMLFGSNSVSLIMPALQDYEFYVLKPVP